MPARLGLWLHRVRGHTCENCRFAESFRSNGDGQVTRLQTFCRCPVSPYQDRPIPIERLCPYWETGNSPDKPQVGDSSLTV